MCAISCFPRHPLPKAHTAHLSSFFPVLRATLILLVRPPPFLSRYCHFRCFTRSGAPAHVVHSPFLPQSWLGPVSFLLSLSPLPPANLPIQVTHSRREMRRGGRKEESREVIRYSAEGSSKVFFLFVLRPLQEEGDEIGPGLKIQEMAISFSKNQSQGFFLFISVRNLLVSFLLPLPSEWIFPLGSIFKPSFLPPPFPKLSSLLSPLPALIQYVQ